MYYNFDMNDSAVVTKKLVDLTPDTRNANCDVIVTRWEQATGKKAVRDGANT